MASKNTVVANALKACNAMKALNAPKTDPAAKRAVELISRAQDEISAARRAIQMANGSSAHEWYDELTDVWKTVDKCRLGILRDPEI